MKNAAYIMGALLACACGGGGFTSSGVDGGGGGFTSSGVDGGGGGVSSCTPFNVSAPALPARCKTVVNNGCDPGDICLTLEQPYPSIQQAAEDRCLPSQIETTCAGCRETMTCACLAADFTFNKTGLEKWRCCDTAAGPLYVLYYGCPAT